MILALAVLWDFNEVGKLVIFSSSKQRRRWLRITEGIRVCVHGLTRWHRSSAKAMTKSPQSDPPLWRCTSTWRTKNVASSHLSMDTIINKCLFTLFTNSWLWSLITISTPPNLNVKTYNIYTVIISIQLDNSIGEPLCAILQFSLTYTSSCTRIVQLLQQICLKGPQPWAILKNSPPIKVTMYLLPLEVIGNGPTRSIPTCIASPKYKNVIQHFKH